MDFLVKNSLVYGIEKIYCIAWYSNTLNPNT
jgi:hypothetical protein